MIMIAASSILQAANRAFRLRSRCRSGGSLPNRPYRSRNFRPIPRTSLGVYAHTSSPDGSRTRSRRIWRRMTRSDSSNRTALFIITT
jgi:hypothetical protein